MCNNADHCSSPCVSIWSVREDVRNLYSWFFTVLMLLGTGYILVSGGAKTLEEFGADCHVVCGYSNSINRSH